MGLACLKTRKFERENQDRKGFTINIIYPPQPPKGASVYWWWKSSLLSISFENQRHFK